jgi:cytochrome P450
MLTWLIDEINSTGTTHTSRRTVRTLTRTLLNVNFGAIHTTTQSFLHALYNLAAYPEYAAPLREEIEAVVRAEGWTKTAMGKMPKLDSFLKETGRTTPGGAGARCSTSLPFLIRAMVGSNFTVGMMRKVLKNFTFVDGTTVPAGTLVGVPILAEHLDEVGVFSSEYVLFIIQPDAEPLYKCNQI